MSTQVREASGFEPQGGRPGPVAKSSSGYWAQFVTLSRPSLVQARPGVGMVASHGSVSVDVGKELSQAPPDVPRIAISAACLTASKVRFMSVRASQLPMKDRRLGVTHGGDQASRQGTPGTPPPTEKTTGTDNRRDDGR